ncbi:MAG: hypothetical protein ACTSR8_12150 [Promethearchaeota archaeon]
MLENLIFFRNLLEKINNGATGFELADFVEENQKMKDLIYDGILFYNNFIEIGEKKFIDMPNKREVSFQSFKNLEDSEKVLLMNWITEQIEKYESILSNPEIFEEHSQQEERTTELKRKVSFIICSVCGASLRGDNIKICTTCGSRL